MQTLKFIAVTAFTASGLWTVKDPFVGHWRFDIGRSRIVDQMLVKAIGPNRYGFNFEGGPTETVVADGTDQPGLPGTTLAVKAVDNRNLTVVRKKDGRTIVLANWKLSSDGRTLRDTFMSVQPDGSKARANYVYRRVAGTSGFAGAWESTTKPIGLKLELAIEPFGNKGLSFVSAGSNRNVTFDGHEHAAGDKAGVTTSGRRIGPQSMEYVEKNGGKVQRSRQFHLSRDGRLLTESLHTAGQGTPDVFVFERE
jgi:hypothetical protein